MKARGKQKIPSNDTTAAEHGGSRERERGPGGDHSGGKDGSTLKDVSSSLTLGKPCQLHRTFGLFFLFQFIPLSFEVVEVASARLRGRLGQTHV